MLLHEKRRGDGAGGRRHGAAHAGAAGPTARSWFRSRDEGPYQGDGGSMTYLEARLDGGREADSQERDMDDRYALAVIDPELVS